MGKKCWVDNSKCYYEASAPTIEMCVLCQKTRVNRYAIRHEQPPVVQ